jgi:hypothetical protein
MEDPQKLTTELQYYPAGPVLGIYLKERKSAYSRDTCTAMCIATLFTIANLWNQPSSPSTDKWIKKTWYTYTMEYYSAIQKQ